MSDVVKIATDYLIENSIKRPHLQCERVSVGLCLMLRDKGIDAKVVKYDVDMDRYNGQRQDWMRFDVIEHHCIKIGSKILDATAGQFNNNGLAMPTVYYGSLPMWYKS